jgi:hypothetical protein
MRSRNAATLVLVLLLTAVHITTAQERFGAITGRVTDQTDLATPGVLVTLTNKENQRVTSVVVGPDGTYTARGLEPGRYSVKFELQGFIPKEAPDVIVLLGQTATVDATLQVGGQTETVQVVATTPLIDQTSTTRSRNIPVEEFEAIPKGRSFQSLAAVLPSVQTGELEGGTQVNGASAGENNFMIDGVSVVSQINGGQRQDAVFDYLQEVQVKTTGLSAEFGGAMGGVISAVTKSGGNTFHGSAFEYFGASWLRPDNGLSPRLQIDPVAQNSASIIQDNDQDYRRNEFGGSLGGPIMAGKLFFFGTLSPRLEDLTRNYGDTGSINRERRTYSTFGKLTTTAARRLIVNVSALWTPDKATGVLIAHDGALPNSTASSATDLAARNTLGYEVPQRNLSFTADYTIDNRTLASIRGGYLRDNYFDTGVDRSQTFEYNTTSIGLAGVPAQFQQAAGYRNLPRIQFNNRDITTRRSLDASLTRYVSGGGEHALKAGFGYLRASNDVELAYPNNGYVTVYWDQTFTSDVPGVGSGRGTYGYYAIDDIGTIGKTSANIYSLYLQDNWVVTPRLTLNLGLRSEKEQIPSYRQDLRAVAIEFGWQDKLAPRIGAAYNVFGDDRLKVSGSWGRYYDFTKYELARGTFGGDSWTTRYRTLDDPDPTKLSRAALTGRNLWTNDPDSFKDSRIPSFGDDVVDSNMKPMSQQTFNVGADYQVGARTVLSVNFVRSQLVRTIEDIGTLVNGSESYIYGNPGEGLATTAITTGATEPFTLPKPKRNYTALEFIANRRFSNNWFVGGSYVLSRLYGNYPGLVNTDEVTTPGRTSVGAQEAFGQRTRPGTNASRAWDLDEMMFDSHGNLGVDGLLPTDRPHQLKAYGSYLFRFGTSVGVNYFAASGTPISRSVQSALRYPILVDGRGSLGRTPFLNLTDLLVAHDLKMGNGGKRVRLEFNVINLFDQRTVRHVFDTVNRMGANGRVLPSAGLRMSAIDLQQGYDYVALLEQTDAAKVTSGPVAGYQDPRYGIGDIFNPGRDIRLAVRFMF